MSTPVWFRPVKTTDQIREELTHSYSLAGALKKVKKLALPQPTGVAVSRGMDMADMVLVSDYADTAGTSIVAKGDHLTVENMDKLADAGVKEVTARRTANMDKYVVLEEMKDSTGAAVIAMHDMLSEETVTTLVMMGKQEINARQSANMETFVVMKEYADKSGAELAKKGDALGEDVITKLIDPGIMEISIAPATPTEIACAQLCGLGHLVRGYDGADSGRRQEMVRRTEAAVNPPTPSN
jgi:hypothetical protein